MECLKNVNVFVSLLYCSLMKSWARVHLKQCMILNLLCYQQLAYITVFEYSLPIGLLFANVAVIEHLMKLME